MYVVYVIFSFKKVIFGPQGIGKVNPQTTRRKLLVKHKFDA